MEKAQQEILMAMGTLLVSLQTVEKVFKAIITVILPRNGEGIKSFDEFLSQEKEEERKTLGYFLQELRKRADINPEFDNILKEFLSMRNDFIHDLGRVPGFDLETKKGMATAIKFLDKLMMLTDTVTKVMFGLGRAWQKQNGIIFKNIDEHELTKIVDSQYVPLVNEIFYKVVDPIA